MSVIALPVTSGGRATQHEATMRAWLAEATQDLKAPTLGSALKWTRRCAQARARWFLAERDLKQIEAIDLSNHYRADAMPTDAGRELVMANGVGAGAFDLVRGEMAEAVEAVELAERIARLIEMRKAA